jgi:hypothetical protein
VASINYAVTLRSLRGARVNGKTKLAMSAIESLEILALSPKHSMALLSKAACGLKVMTHRESWKEI